MNNNDRFPQGVAIIIGGSGGVGKAICKAFAEAGTSVLLTYRSNQQAAEACAEELQALGVSAMSCAYSATQAGDAERVCQLGIEHFGSIHTVVNAAGADIPMRYIGQIPEQLWRDVIDSDLNGFFNLVQASLPHLRNSGGSLVQISSAGLQRWPKRDALSVAPKAAIESLLQGVAKEEGRYGVRANSVQLGVIEAGMFLRLKGEDFDDEWVEAARENTALKRFGTAEDVAQAALFLASKQAAYITGQVIKMDGGYSI